MIGLALAVVAAQVIVKDPVQLRQSLDPLAELRSHVERLTGDAPIDCGQATWAPRGPNADRLDTETLERAIACARESAAKGKPFLTFISHSELKSWIASGLVGRADGTMMTFFFDSMPCGDARCPSRFDAESCERPAARKTDKGFVSFDCDAR